MKICVVARNINSDYTGSFEFDQAIALSEFGHEVYVLSLDFRSVRRKRKFGIYLETHKGIVVMRCSVPIGPIKIGLVEHMENLAYKKDYTKLEKIAGGFDLVNSHFLMVSYITLRSMKKELKSDVPIVVTEHYSALNKNKNEIPTEIVKKAEFVYHNADRIISVSSALAEKIKENFDVDSDVVFNVFDGRIFDGKKRSHDDDDNFTFVSAGNLTENKRMNLLIRSFAKAFHGDEHTHLYIFGDGPERDSLEKLIAELKMSDRVFLLGRKPRAVLADFYESADVFALLSKRETFGVAYIEAMASGMPVLACHSGGPEDFLIPEVGMFTRDEEMCVAEALKKIKAERKTYNDDFIKKYAHKICGSREIAEQLTEIYERVI